MSSRRYILPTDPNNSTNPPTQTIQQTQNTDINTQISSQSPQFNNPWTVNNILDKPANEFGKRYPLYFRPACSVIPYNEEVFQNVGIPQAMIITPALVTDLTTINYTRFDVPRCRKCYSYLSPYIKIQQDGRTYKCPMCDEISKVNDETLRQLGGLNSFKEISNQVYEYIAPRNYVHKPGSCQAFCVIIDTSKLAFETNFIYNFVECVKASINQLPDTAKISLILTSKEVSVFDFEKHEEIVITDTSDINFPLPKPVELSECKEAFIARLDDVIAAGPKSEGHSYGSALEVAIFVHQYTGGVVMAGVCGRPREGVHAIPARVITAQTTDVDLLTSQGSDADFWRKIGFQLNRTGILVNLFCCNTKEVNADTASMATPSVLTGGEVYLYDITKETLMNFDVFRLFTCEYLYDVTFRLRACDGVKLTHMHGNFAVIEKDLICFPILNPYHAISIGYAVEKPLCVREALFQGALIYTTKDRVRKIRIFNFALQTSPDILAVRRSLDESCLVSLFAKQCGYTLFQRGTYRTQDFLNDQLIQMRKKGVNIATMLQLAHGLFSSDMLNPYHPYLSDGRIVSIVTFRMMSIIDTCLLIYPRLFALDTKEGPLPLNQFCLRSGFVIGVHMYDKIIIWVSSLTPADYLKKAFNADTFDSIPNNILDIGTEESHDLVEFVTKCMEISMKYIPCEIIPQGDQRESIFDSIFVDDAAQNRLSLNDWSAKLQ